MRRTETSALFISVYVRWVSRSPYDVSKMLIKMSVRNGLILVGERIVLTNMTLNTQAGDNTSRCNGLSCFSVYRNMLGQPHERRKN